MLYKYLFLFILYSIIGFVIEELVFLWHNGYLKNNHFLTLWYTPMYGFGGLFIALFLDKVNNIFLIFLASIAITLTVEYISSFLLEKVFNIRWWDYKILHIKGRICLYNAINFGLLGIIVNFISPYIIDSLKYNNLTVITIIIVIIIGIDLLISSVITYKLTHNKKVKDNIITNRIKEKVDNNKELFGKYD